MPRPGQAWAEPKVPPLPPDPARRKEGPRDPPQEPRPLLIRPARGSERTSRMGCRLTGWPALQGAGSREARKVACARPPPLGGGPYAGDTPGGPTSNRGPLGSGPSGLPHALPRSDH